MIILIVGPTGVGKTSLAVAMGIKAMDNGQDDIEVYNDRIQSYSGYSKVKIPTDHFVYSDIFMCGSESSNNLNIPHFTTGFRMGLKNEDFEVDYFPYGSTIILDETRKYWPARKSMLGYEKGGVHESTLEFFELHRHNNLTIILISHFVTDVDVKIRELAHLVIAPYDIDIELVGNKLKYEQTHWKYRVFKSVSDYDLFMHGNKEVEFEAQDYIFNDNIMDYYDTEFFLFKFLYGLNKKYSNVRLKPCNGTRASVRRLVELYGKIYALKNGNKIKKKVEESGRQKSERITYQYI